MHVNRLNGAIWGLRTHDTSKVPHVKYLIINYDKLLYILEWIETHPILVEYPKNLVLFGILYKLLDIVFVIDDHRNHILYKDRLFNRSLATMMDMITPKAYSIPRFCMEFSQTIYHTISNSVYVKEPCFILDIGILSYYTVRLDIVSIGDFNR